MLNDKSQHLIDMVRSVIDRGIQFRLDTGLQVDLSKLIIDELNTDYSSLNALLQSVDGCSLDDFITSRILEKVKELLVYTEQYLPEIAYALGYRSPAYLSSQLLKHTGLSPFHFKVIRMDKLEIIKNSEKESS